MPCYHPLTGYRSKDLNPSGKRSIVFNPGPSAALSGAAIKLPCGQCIGCRLERSRNWAVRCVHEASLYDDNSFITLTYANEHVPPDGSLVLSHFQKFMKRLRRAHGDPIRFFHCGEYGEKKGRPHYHAILFNLDFRDKVLTEISPTGEKYFRSAFLEKVWPFGKAIIGNVTFESAAYVARYITKKITGPGAEKHYAGRKPEYVTMSRRPGIAQAWFEKYKADLFPDDFVVIDARTMPVPRFYVQKLSDAEQLELKRERHRNAALSNRADSSHLRLLTREMVHELKAETLKRTYEHEA